MFDQDENQRTVEYVFAPSERDYIANILRGAFKIRTADGEEDELLGDFIEALDNADCICFDGEDAPSDESDGDDGDLGDTFGAFFHGRFNY